MDDPAVEARGLGKAYRARSRWGWRTKGNRWALRDVGLTVPSGAMEGVVGGNGSGKTTLLQVLSGVLSPSAGTVRTRGRVASLVDLTAGFHRDLTGHENLMVGGVLLGIGRRELRARYDEIVAFSGLDPDALHSPLSSYSAGMGLRLGFSLVVCSEPDVLLVDEVLAVGDEAFRERGLARIDVLRSRGCAVVLVSHDLEMVSRRCDHVTVLHRGEVAASGPPLETVAEYVAQRGTQAETPPPERMFAGSWRAGRVRRRRGA